MRLRSSDRPEYSKIALIISGLLAGIIFNITLSVFGDISSLELLTIFLSVGATVAVFATYVAQYYQQSQREKEIEKLRAETQDIEQSLREKQHRMEALETEFESILQEAQKSEGDLNKLKKQANSIKNRYEVLQLQYHIDVSTLIYMRNSLEDGKIDDTERVLKKYYESLSDYENIMEKSVEKEKQMSSIDPEISEVIEKYNQNKIEEDISLSEVVNNELTSSGFRPLAR